MKTGSRSPKALRVGAGLAAVLMTGPAAAAVIGVAGGTGAPSTTLGPFAMTGFADDIRSPFDSARLVASPTGGVVVFSPDRSLRRIGFGWNTWSHGYAGDVYFNNTGRTALTLPENTGAFYFYVQPNTGDPDVDGDGFVFTATSNGGGAVSQFVESDGGAAYFGFYATGGDTVDSIVVTTSDPAGFAIGEFGIAVLPEPASFALLAVAGGLTLCRRRGRATA